ncbi:MAG TPA: alkaline phosphatase [Methylophilaceae bacterium]|nr:alkaline phosphatase [Methylophilaceae bacterium]
MRSYIDKLIAIGMMVAALPAQCGEPIVQGPESVQDWYEAGQRFIRDAEQLEIRARKAKNVILFVGDGMGISTLTAARILEGQLQGRTGEENRLSFEDFPYAALSKTYTWDQQTPDSAPTMTAMITGYKAREGMLSVDHQTPRGECNSDVVAAHALPTLLEQAAAAGKATGVVSTARLTHATPAATYAHTPMRDWESDADLPAGCGVKDIARQLIEVSLAVRDSLKVAMGGGRTNFMPAVRDDPESGRKGKRQDGRDLVAEWQQTRGPGARYVWNRAGFDAIDPAATTHLLGLFESSHMQYELDRAKDKSGEPSLTEMTEKAIRILQKDKSGIFLHVEAGRIDHAHHSANAKRALVEVIELARAVRKAREMTDPAETLIIVTADHSHVFTMAGYPHRGNDILGLVAEVPEKDGEERGLKKDKLGLPYTTLGYANGPGWRSPAADGGKRPDLAQVDTHADDYLPEAAVPLESETHGGEDVAIFAAGPMAHLIHGSMEQNWIYHVMRRAFGF